MATCDIDWYHEEYLFAFQPAADFYACLHQNKLPPNQRDHFFDDLDALHSTSSDNASTSGVSSAGSDLSPLSNGDGSQTIAESDGNSNSDDRFAAFMKAQIASRPPPKRPQPRMSFSEVVQEDNHRRRIIDDYLRHGTMEYYHRAMQQMLHGVPTKAERLAELAGKTLPQKANGTPTDPRLRIAPYPKPVPLSKRLAADKPIIVPTHEWSLKVVQMPSFE